MQRNASSLEEWSVEFGAGASPGRKLRGKGPALGLKLHLPNHRKGEWQTEGFGVRLGFKIWLSCVSSGWLVDFSEPQSTCIS